MNSGQRQKILFLSTGNSVRSIFAEYFIKRIAGVIDSKLTALAVNRQERSILTSFNCCGIIIGLTRVAPIVNRGRSLRTLDSISS